MKFSKQLFKKVLGGVFFLKATLAQAQDFTSPIQNFLETNVEPLFPLVVAGVFIWTGVANIGMINDPNSRDWKGFLSKIGIFALAAAVMVVLYEFLKGLSL